MQLVTIDQIVRRTLLEKGLPIHYYAEFLFHGCTSLREFNIDTLRWVNTVSLPVNEDGSVDLPQDFMDDIGVCSQDSGLLIPMPKKDSISPLRQVNGTTGDFERVYATQNEQVLSGLTFGLGWGWGWYWNIDDYSEPTGRFFGSRGGDNVNGYQVFKERRQIQMAGSWYGQNIILPYISDGQSVDNASQIDIQAIAAIQAWINWKRTPNAENDNSPEGRHFYNQRRLLRGRLSDLTKTDLMNIFYNAYTAAPKT